MDTLKIKFTKDVHRSTKLYCGLITYFMYCNESVFRRVKCSGNYIYYTI
jgi:hypothetical protein